MEPTTSAALVTTIESKLITLTGLSRRFNDEKNQLAAATAAALGHQALQEARTQVKQLDESDDESEHFPELRQHARDSLDAVANVAATLPILPEDIPPPQDSWHLPYINLLADIAAIKHASAAAILQWKRGREELAMSYANAVHTLERRCITHQNTAKNRRMPIPRPKGSNRTLHNQTIGAAEQQHKAHLNIHHICRRYMNVILCPAIGLEQPTHETILAQADAMRNDAVDVVTAQLHTEHPRTGELRDHEVVYFEYDDAIHVKTVEENFPTGYEYYDLLLHTKAILQNAQAIRKIGTSKAGHRARYLRTAISWTLRFYEADLHDVHQLDIHRLLMEVLDAGYTVDFIKETVIPIITYDDHPLSVLLANQTGIDETSVLIHEPAAVATDPRDQVIRTAFSIGLAYPVVVKLADSVSADAHQIWDNLRELVRAPIRERNERYLASTND